MKKTICIFLIFFLLLGIPIPAFAETTSDVIPPALDPSLYNSYFIYQDSSKYRCILYLDSDWDFYAKKSNSSVESLVNLTLFESFSTSRPAYEAIVDVSNYDISNPNNGWGDFSEIGGGGYVTDSDGNRRTYHVFLFDTDTDVVLDSSQTVYYGQVNDTNDYVIYSDTVFFYQPLTLEETTAEALTQFQIQTTQTIMIILLCGIGCLAFLISLPILRKVLLRFLNR